MCSGGWAQLGHLWALPMEEGGLSAMQGRPVAEQGNLKGHSVHPAAEQSSECSLALGCACCHPAPLPARSPSPTCWAQP